jgi:hypothetical protein
MRILQSNRGTTGHLTGIRAQLLDGRDPRVIGSADAVDGKPKPNETGLSVFEMDIEQGAAEMVAAETIAFTDHLEEHAQAWNSRRASEAESELGSIEAQFSADLMQTRAEANDAFRVAALAKQRATRVFNHAYLRAGLTRPAAAPPSRSATCFGVAIFILLEWLAGFAVLRESVGQFSGAGLSVAVTVMNGALGAGAGWGWLHGSDKSMRTKPTTPFAIISWLTVAAMAFCTYGASVVRALLVAGTPFSVDAAVAMMSAAPLAPMLAIENSVLAVLGAASFAVSAGGVHRYLLGVHGLRTHAEASAEADATWEDLRSAFTVQIGVLAGEALQAVDVAEDAADAWRRAGRDFVNAVTGKALRVNQRIELIEQAVAGIWREYRAGNSATRDAADPPAWRRWTKPDFMRVQVPASVITGADELEDMVTSVRTRGNQAREYVASHQAAEIANLDRFFGDLQAAADRDLDGEHDDEDD